MNERPRTPAALKRMSWRRAALLVVASFLILVAVAAGSGAPPSAASPAVKPAKPARPEHDHPNGKGLLTAIGVGISADAGRVQAPSAVTAVSEGQGVPDSVNATTLVLYDTTGAYGWLGELYAMATANLASHFGAWTAKPVSAYEAGEIATHTATVYIGSTYDEPLPTAFLDDVYNATKPVIWIYDNIWELTNRYSSTFQAKYGWSWSQFDPSVVNAVRYKGITLTRDGGSNGAGIMSYSFIDPAKAQALADAVRADGTTFPWAIRSGSLTYMGENPFPYTSETDRLLAFEDILFTVLDPAAPTRHRALVRLEDISPATDTTTLKSCVDYLYGLGIPFGFGVSPVYVDPLAVENRRPTTIRLKDSQVAQLVAYMQGHGGTLVEHGYTHQYSNVRNPYNAVTGDDFEFYRVVENADHSLTMQGPLPGDSTAWALSRLDASAQELAGAGTARIYETPHYTASAADYQAFAQRFEARWERALYYSGQLAGGAVASGHVIGQMFPYVVRDVYGDVVLPENIGNYEPEPFYTYPVHTVADVLNGAARNMVVRDGFASFYYHPFNGAGPLGQIVQGLRAQGWVFVSPAELAGVPPVVAPANVTPPTVSGLAVSGQTLTASPGTWSGDPTPALAYRWQRCSSVGASCVTIGGATTNRLKLGQKDVGFTIRVQVTATNAGGSALATSGPTAVVRRR